MDIVERFTNYIKIDTQSSETTGTHPSTEKQFRLAELLAKELREMGASDVRVSDTCYVYARVPGNLPEEDAARTPKLGLIAHMDTSPSASGADVNPRIISSYDGGDIFLGGDSTQDAETASGRGIVLSPRIFPLLSTMVGDDLMVTDGRTLLGADDKAGVAEIMQTAEYFLTHPEEPHGELWLAFTPDEEIGQGTECFDLSSFGAEVGFTVDGGTLGEIEYENFNAASADVRITGVNVHPGTAKNKMINASLVAMEFDRLLPPERPCNTEGYEGFFHLNAIEGDECSCRMHYIIRDHDRAKFEKRKEQFLAAAEELNRKYAGTAAHVEASAEDRYYNMREKIEPEHMYLIDLAREAFRKAGVEPKTVPIRGGTDGARLSYMGLPCPNLSTGGGNYHGIYEYLNITSMRKMLETLILLVKGMRGAKH